MEIPIYIIAKQQEKQTLFAATPPQNTLYIQNSIHININI